MALERSNGSLDIHSSSKMKDLYAIDLEKENPKAYVDIKKQSEGLSAQVAVESLQSPEVREVESLGDGRCMMPYDWEGVNRNFYFTRTYDPRGFLLEIKRVDTDGNETVDTKDVDYAGVQEFYQDANFGYILGDILNEVIGNDRAAVPEKGEKVHSLLFLEATEFDGYARDVEQTGLNKTSLPYDLGNKKCDFEFTAEADNTVSITKTTREIVDNTLQEYQETLKPVPLNDFDNTYIGSLLNNAFPEYGDKRPKVPVKANQVMTVIKDPLLKDIFEKASFITYEKSKVTYGMTLDYYKEELIGNIDFKNIPVAERFSVVLNAVLDYNKSLFPQWHAETTDDFFLPKDMSFYQKYIDGVGKNNVARKEKVTTIEDEKSLRFSDKLDHMLAYGRNGFMKVGERGKKKEENYNAMERSLFDTSLEGTTRKKYIDKAFRESNLSPSMKRLCPYIPMQESSYRNVKAPSNGEYTAGGMWQFIKPTGRKYGLKIKGKTDERNDIAKSTTAAIKYLGDIYNDLNSNEDFQDLVKIYALEYAERDFILTFLSINAFNSGEGHMRRALHILRTNTTENAKAKKYIEEHGSMGIILYITNDYPKRHATHQKKFKYKYHIESPEYVYNIMKYRQIETSK